MSTVRRISRKRKRTDPDPDDSPPRKKKKVDEKKEKFLEIYQSIWNDYLTEINCDEPEDGIECDDQFQEGVEKLDKMMQFCLLEVSKT